MSRSALRAVDRVVSANKKRAEYAAVLLRDLVPPMCLKVHFCGDGCAGKTALSSALRRSAIGSKLRFGKEFAADVPAQEDPDRRTRGVQVHHSKGETALSTPGNGFLRQPTG